MSAQPRPQSSAGADARSLVTENHCFPNEGLEPRGHNGPFERFRGADQPAGDPVSVEGAKTRKRNGPGRLVPRPLPEARFPFRLGLPALPCRGCNALVAHHVSKKEAWQSHRVRGAAKTRWRMGPVILNGHYDGRVILHSSRNLFLRVIGEKPMIRLIAVAFALVLATSVQAMPVAPLHQPEGMTTQVRMACGAGRVRINGVCVARTTRRHVRRSVRRCAVWGAGHVCHRWVY